MDTEFKPRKELFRPCCGHCIFGMKRKLGDTGTTIFKCKKDKRLHNYGHICDVTSTDDGEQMSIFDDGVCDAKWSDLYLDMDSRLLKSEKEAND